MQIDCIKKLSYRLAETFESILRKFQNVHYLEQVVQSGKRLNEKVGSLVGEFVSSSSEEVQNFIKIKVVVAESINQTQY